MLKKHTAWLAPWLRRSGPWIKYGLGIALLVCVIWANWSPASGPGLSSVWQKHIIDREPVNVEALTLACVIGLASVLLTFIRWYVLVRAQDLPFTLTNALRLGLIGFSLSTFLPGSIGGDIIKAAFIAREQSRRTVAVATVLIDRAIGLWGLGWLVALLGGLFWAHGDLAGQHGEKALQSIVLTAAVLVAASMAVWFLLGVLPAYRAQRFAGRLERIPKVGHSAAEFWRAIWMYRCKGRSIALTLLMAMVGHIGFVLTFYFAALTVLSPDAIPSMAKHFVIVPIGMAFQAGFPAPGGVGGGEVAYGWVYEQVGFLFASGVLASLVQRVINWALGLVGYVVYLRMRPTLLKSQGAGITEQESMNGTRAADTAREPQLLSEP
ncbi:MAG TPA: lysylphosphatidylglycerol synthase transmembrane domain-containing protein [Gemmataceae bacterium]|nr:lysylphosphatidylglycerol synthase transmembrane domain-containing protein [Gemmataceae bacterium]